jgi:hypothetical protein
MKSSQETLNFILSDEARRKWEKKMQEQDAYARSHGEEIKEIRETFKKKRSLRNLSCNN